MSDLDAVRNPRSPRSPRRRHTVILGGGALWGLVLALAGCEVNTFFDPSDVGGRTESTPAVMPILDRLEIIGDAPTVPPGLSQVTPEDLEIGRAHV